MSKTNGPPETYRHKLEDPKWRELRESIIARDEWMCQGEGCGVNITEALLNVHHRYYIADTEPWDYPDSAFTTLCPSCHGAEYFISVCRRTNQLRRDRDG